MPRAYTMERREKIGQEQSRRDARRQQGAPASGSSWIRGNSRQDDPSLKAARAHNQTLVSRLLSSHSVSIKTANRIRRRYGANAQRLRVVAIEALRVMGELHVGEMPDNLLTEDEVLAEDARLKLTAVGEGAAVEIPGWHAGLVLVEGKKGGEKEVEEAYNSNWELEDEDEEMGETGGTGETGGGEGAVGEGEGEGAGDDGGGTLEPVSQPA